MKTKICKVCPSSILCCVAQKSLEILKSVSAVFPRLAQFISEGFRISSLSLALTPLDSSKHISCLLCYWFASTNRLTPAAVQAFQPFYPCPNLNQLNRDVKGKRNIGRVSGLVKWDWPSDSAVSLLNFIRIILTIQWQITHIGIPRDKDSRTLFCPQWLKNQPVAYRKLGSGVIKTT